MIVNDFFTAREQHLMRKHKQDPDGLTRSQYLELIEAFDRFIDNTPRGTDPAIVSEAKYLVASLNGRVAGMDTEVLGEV